MKKLGRHLSYANVMSTLGVFLVLAGGTAFAATQLAKKSVGTKQLKANAVTAAKIKKNAVTKAKIKKGSIDSSKVIDGSLTGTDINSASTPFSRIVFEARGTSTVALPNKKEVFYPVAPASYTQEAGSDDSYTGAVNVTIPASCKEDRSVVAYLLVDAPGTDLTKPENANSIAGWGVYQDESSSEVTKQIPIGPYLFGGNRFQPATPTNHTLALVLAGECKTGSGISATSGSVDVIGVKK